MNSSPGTTPLVLVDWFEMNYECPRCGCDWEDEWTCPCNDRCPDCDLECEPISYNDQSRALEEEDYIYAAGRVASLGHPPEFEPIDLPRVSDEIAKEYAEARLEGE